MIRQRLHQYFLSTCKSEGESLIRVIYRHRDTWHGRYHAWYCEKYGGAQGSGWLGFWRSDGSPLWLVPASMFVGWVSDWSATWALRPPTPRNPS